MDRSATLARIRERGQPWDVVIIGGGATGVGCALDAASRGLDVLLLEQDDFGKGTSSRSTKLIHGGVRYLAQGDLSLVREALRERAILLRNAPHAVHKIEFVVPCYSLRDKLFYGSGLKIYDLLAAGTGYGRSRLLSREETIERVPNIRQQGLVGGVLYPDGQFDDARLLIDMVGTASANQATLINYARVYALDKDSSGRLRSFGFEDVLTGERFSGHAKSFINAAGIFSDAVAQLPNPDAGRHLIFSQGAHLVFDRRFMTTETAVMIPKTSDRRVLFCIPWQGSLLVGTTDTPVKEALLEPAAREREIDFILETAGGYLEEPPTRDDVRSVFAGIRPLAAGAGSAKTSSLSRGHILYVDSSGLVTITGGKWTTYRRMAEDAVNAALKVGGLGTQRCFTAELPIAPLSSAGEGEKLHPALSYSTDDVRNAVVSEMAMRLEDILARRTRTLFLDARIAVEIAPAVAQIMARELKKDEDWINREIADFRAVAASYSIS